MGEPYLGLRQFRSPPLDPARLKSNVSLMQFTIPNLLTISRVIAAPLVAGVFLVFDKLDAQWIAFWIFSIAALTDYFDGHLARKWGQVSGFGRMLDPIADKAMVVVAGAVLVGLYDMAGVVLIPVTIVLLREVMVSGLREYLKGAKILDVTFLAKIKTTAQLTAMGALFLAGPLTGTKGDVVLYAGYVMLWVAAALTAWTGWDYFVKGVAHIKAEEET